MIDFRDRFLKERRAYFERVQGPRPRNRNSVICEDPQKPRGKASKSFGELRNSDAEDLRSDTRRCTRLSFSDTSGGAACGILSNPVGTVLIGVMLLHTEQGFSGPRSTGLSCISTSILRMRCGQCKNAWSLMFIDVH